jgi:glycosyltransferase involved in cell wall biosynthesis
MYRLAVVASHPIQYQAPWFRALAKVTDLEVFFCHRQDAAGQAAAGFGVEFEWDIPLLDGYCHAWLDNRSRHPDVSSFFGCDTPEIGERLRRGKFDACIVSGWYLKSYVQAIFSARQAGVRVLSRGDSQLATSRSALLKTAKYFPYRWLLGSIDAHLYVGRANRAYLQHYGVPATRLFFAPHFVDNGFFATRAQIARDTGVSREVRASHGIPFDVAVFAFAGKLIDKKRPADLIRALTTARQRGSQSWGLIIGSGPLQPELEALCRQLDAPVRFAGFRNQSELPQYFAAADALVLPSDARETWGLVVNEAMACGLPAIVSDGCGCAADLIESGKTGITFSVGDDAALTAAIETLNALLVRDERNVRESVLARIAAYSCEAAVAGTMEALESVAATGVSRTSIASPLAG